MAEASTMGRDAGGSQSHEHEKRDRSYSFQSGGTTVSVDTPSAEMGEGMNGYSAAKGGGTVSPGKSTPGDPLPPGVSVPTP